MKPTSLQSSAVLFLFFLQKETLHWCIFGKQQDFSQMVGLNTKLSVKILVDYWIATIQASWFQPLAFNFLQIMHFPPEICWWLSFPIAQKSLVFHSSSFLDAPSPFIGLLPVLYCPQTYAKTFQKCCLVLFTLYHSQNPASNLENKLVLLLRHRFSKCKILIF